MSIKGPPEETVASQQLDIPFTTIINGLAPGLIHKDNRYLLHISRDFVKSHATTNNASMPKAKPGYMTENEVFTCQFGRKQRYSIPWVVGYLLSNYSNLRNSFLHWICDKLVVDLTATTSYLDTAGINYLATYSQTHNSYSYSTDDFQSQDHSQFSHPSMIQYWTPTYPNSLPNQLTHSQSCILQTDSVTHTRQPQQPQSNTPSSTCTSSNTKTKIAIDQEVIAAAKTNPLSIDLSGKDSVRYECTNCGCSVIVPSKNNRPGDDARKKHKEFDDLVSATKATLTSKVMTIMTILMASVVFEPLNAPVPGKIQLLAYYFRNNMNELKSIIVHIMNQCKTKAIELRKITQMQTNSILRNLETENTLYFLDWYLISLGKFEALRKFFNFSSVLKHSNTINNMRQSINAKVKSRFQYLPTGTQANESAENIPTSARQSKKKSKKSKKPSVSSAGMGHCVDPVKIVLALLEIEENESGDLDHLKQKLLTKISVDGSKGVVVMTLTLLNCKVFAVQSRDSCTLISMYRGDEGEEEFRTHFKHVIPSLSHLSTHGLKYKDQEFQCELFVVNDWKAFQHFTNMFEDGMFCGHCDCKLSERHHSYAPDPVTQQYKQYNQRIIVFHNGLVGAKIRYCVLHCKCRSHENLMTNILYSRNDPKLYDLVAERVRQYPTLRKFAWRTERGDEDDDNMDQTVRRFPFSRGLQITEMMMNLEDIIQDIADPCELLLLELNRYIHLVYLEADSESLKYRDLEFLKACCKAFGIVLVYRYPNVKGSYYYHYIIRHVPEEADNDVTWSQLQNQGAEAFHSTDSQCKESASSRGGGRNKIDPDLQRFLLLLRRIYIACKHKMKWLGKESEYNKRVFAKNSNSGENGETEEGNIPFRDQEFHSDDSDEFVDHAVDDDSDGDWESECVSEPQNILEIPIKRVSKISDELISKWRARIDPHVSGIMSEGVAYVDRTFRPLIDKAVYPTLQQLSGRQNLISSQHGVKRASPDESIDDDRDAKRHRSISSQAISSDLRSFWDEMSL